MQQANFRYGRPSSNELHPDEEHVKIKTHCG